MVGPMAEPIMRLEQLVRSSRAREQRVPFRLQGEELGPVCYQRKFGLIRWPRPVVGLSYAAKAAWRQPARVNAIRDGHGAVRGAGANVGPTASIGQHATGGAKA